MEAIVKAVREAEAEVMARYLVPLLPISEHVYHSGVSLSDPPDPQTWVASFMWRARRNYQQRFMFVSQVQPSSAHLCCSLQVKVKGAEKYKYFTPNLCVCAILD